MITASVKEKRPSASLQLPEGLQIAGAYLKLASPHPVELAELAQCLGGLTPLFDTGFFIVLASLQLPLDAIDLQLFFQLANGILQVTSYFDFYHDRFTSFVDGMTHLLV